MLIKTFAIPFLAITLAFFAACKDHNHGGDLNIDFPAGYVVNGGEGTVSVIHLGDQKTDGEISLNGATFPHHVYLSPDKTTLAVAITGTDLSGGHGSHGSGTGGYKVMILDAVTGEIHHEINTEHLPHNATFNPSGTELWVPQSDTAGHVIVYKTSDYTELKTIAVGSMPSELTFSTDGSKVFVANTMDGTVTIIDPVTKAAIMTVPVGHDPVGAWPAANGNMYVDNETSQTVQEINVTSGAVTATIALGFKPGYVAYHLHHEELWVSDATHGKVVYYKLENSVWTKKGAIDTGADAHAIAFSNDNATAFVTNQGAGTVSVINIGSHSKTKDISVGSKPNGIVLKQ